MYGNLNFNTTGAELTPAALILFVVVYLGILAVALLTLIAECKMFAKAGLPWERVFVPVYGTYWMFKMVGAKKLFWATIILGVVSGLLAAILGPDSDAFAVLALVVGIAALVMGVIFYVKTAKAFGKGGGFAVGLLLLPFIFVPILGFGSAKYVGESWN